MEATKQKREAPASLCGKIYRYAFRLNAEENLKFLEMFGRSGTPTITKFILGRLFDREFRVYKKDAELHLFYTKLCGFHRQFAAVGNNYNQVVRATLHNFDQRRAHAMLAELKKHTGEMAAICTQVVILSEEFKTLWLAKYGD